MDRTVRAADFMVDRVLTVVPSMPIGQAITFLLKHGIAGAPVVADQCSRTLVGILSERDCMRVVSNCAYYGTPHGTVQDFMSSTVRTVAPDTDIFTIAMIFVDHGYRRLPVVEGNHLVGILSRSDVLKVEARMWDNCVTFGRRHYDYLSPEAKARLEAARYRFKDAIV